MNEEPMTDGQSGQTTQMSCLTIPKRQNLDSSKLKEFANDNFKYDENGGKFSKRVENTVGKGEIARYEQFLLFPHCFQKTCVADTYKHGFVGKWLILHQTAQT